MMGQAHLVQFVKSAFNLDGEPVPRPGSTGGGRLARLAEWLGLRVSWSGISAARGGRALQILGEGDRIKRSTPHRHHLVRSRTDGSRWYDVRQKGSRWSCSCADHLYRKAQCKHILAVMAQVAEREAAVLGVIPGPTGPTKQAEPTGPAEPA